jgi:putative salt-induced outer membrane protein
MTSRGFGVVSISFILGMVAYSGTALAELPDAAKKMLDTAIAGGDQTVIQVIAGTIIQTYPEEADAVRAYLDAAQSKTAVGAKDKINEAAQNQQSVVPKITIVPPAPVTPPPAKGFIGFDGWGGDIQLSGTLNTGNTEEKAAGVAFKLQRAGVKWHHFLDGAFDFTRTNGNTTKQRLRIGYEINYDINARSYIFGTTEYVDDRFSGYDYRIIAAGGYGHRLILRDDMLWEVEAGPGYRYSSLKNQPETESELVGLATSKFKWQINDSVDLSNELDLLYGSKSTSIDTLTAVTMAISSRLSGRISFETNTETSPPAGTKNTDTQTKASLVYGF